MRTIFLASLSVFAGAAVALADGYEPQPVTLAPAGQDWTGAYVGVNAGWMTTDVGGPLFIGGISTFKSDLEDTVVGFHLGYLKQWGSIVAGIEAGYSTTIDADTGNTPGSNALNVGCGIIAGAACESEISNVFQIGGRLGWALDKFLVYGTGGYARADIQTDFRIIATGLLVEPVVEQTHDGWYAGGGVEYAFNKDWSLGVEYQRLEFDTETHVAAPVNIRQIDANSDVVKGRLTFHFDDRQEPAPLK